MPKLKELSGEDIIKMLKDFDFLIAGQKGSHVKLRRTIQDDIKQTLTIPKHKELDKGTLKAIYNQALRYIPEIDLRNRFYKD